MPSVAISIRFSPDEHKQLVGLARQHGQPVGAYIRARLFTAVHADERSVVADRLDRLEKLMKAILLGSVETVDALRANMSAEVMHAAKERANARTNEILRSLLGKPAVALGDTRLLEIGRLAVAAGITAVDATVLAEEFAGIAKRRSVDAAATAKAALAAAAHSSISPVEAEEKE